MTNQEQAKKLWKEAITRLQDAQVEERKAWGKECGHTTQWIEGENRNLNL